MTFNRIRVKFCGMTNRGDIQLAIQLGADAIGVIFYPKSKRYVSIQQAYYLLKELPPFINVVAVLVNPTVAEVDEIIKTLPIDYLQFHGDELPDFCEQFNFPYIKSISALTTDAISLAMTSYNKSSAFLIDTFSENEYGGSGNVFDWSIIPKKRGKPIILAGGLDSSNVVNAIKQVNPYALDVCSGIEQQAGIKNEKLMAMFLKAVHNFANC